MKYASILETIGNTPHINISKLFPTALSSGIEVWMKAERFNPGGSIKDRIALMMVESAEKRGDLRPGMTIIEPTSGNTGIGLAMVAAVKGYPIILLMPESMSIERRRILQAYGARLELTPKEKGMSGAIERAKALLQQQEGGSYWMPSQFENDDNVSAHRLHTAQEIIADFPEGFDYLVAGVGTGGHLSGCAEILKEKFPRMKVIAVEPAASPILSGGKAGPHPLQGIGAGFVPKNLNRTLIDEVITVEGEQAFAFARLAAVKAGIFIGISSGAVLAALEAKLKLIPSHSKVLTFCYDTGERYLSIENLFG